VTALPYAQGAIRNFPALTKDHQAVCVTDDPLETIVHLMWHQVAVDLRQGYAYWRIRSYHEQSPGLDAAYFLWSDDFAVWLSWCLDVEPNGFRDRLLTAFWPEDADWPAPPQPGESRQGYRKRLGVPMLRAGSGGRRLDLERMPRGRAPNDATRNAAARNAAGDGATTRYDAARHDGTTPGP